MSRDIVLAISRLFSSRIYEAARFFTHLDRVESERERKWHSVIERTLICDDFIVDFYRVIKKSLCT